VFGKDAPLDADDHPSQQALLFFVAANWLKYKAARLVFTKTPEASNQTCG